MTERKRGQSAFMVAAIVVCALLVVAGHSVIVAAVSGGGTNVKPSIDDFEDGDTFPFTQWGHTDGPGVFSTTSNALNGSTSGLYEGDLSTSDQPASWSRTSPTSENGSLTLAVSGEDGGQANHSIAWYNGSDRLFSIEYRENSSDFDPGEIIANGSGSTKIGTWDERSTQIQTLTVEFVSGQFATVYINGSDQGTFNLNSAEQSWDRVEINSNIPSSPTVADSQIRVDNLGVNATRHEPIIEDSKSTPTGTLNSKTQQLEVSLKDADFPEDTVTINWIVDGQQVDQSAASANGTYTTQADFVTGGQHTWLVEAVDGYGQTTVSEIQSVEVPSNLTIRNESNPDEIINNTDVEVTFFADNSVVTRTTQDGQADLSGLPTGETLIAQVEADGYRDRRVLIRSLYQQQSVYLLNNSVSSAAISFQIDDATGDFSAQGTQLAVQRALNQSGTTSYRTIIADEVGADQQLATTLEIVERYRLVVRSVDGETRVLGSYTADGPQDPEIIPIGTLQFEGRSEAGTNIGASLRDTGSGRQVRIVYHDRQTATRYLNLTVTNTDSGNEILNTSILDPQERHIESVPVPAAAPDNVTYNVSYDTERIGENDTSGFIIVGDTPDPATNWPIDSTVLEYAGWLFTFALAGWFGLRAPRAAPVATVVVATALTILGVFRIPPVLLGLAGATSVTWLFAGGER